jgi:hypothetical protein
MVEIQICDVDVLCAPFSHAQQWIGILLGFLPSSADVTMETKACTLLWDKNNIRAVTTETMACSMLHRKK